MRSSELGAPQCNNLLRGTEWGHDDARRAPLVSPPTTCGSVSLEARILIKTPSSDLQGPCGRPGPASRQAHLESVSIGDGHALPPRDPPAVIGVQRPLHWHRPAEPPPSHSLRSLHRSSSGPSLPPTPRFSLRGHSLNVSGIVASFSNPFLRNARVGNARPPFVLPVRRGRNLFAAGDDVGGVPWMCSPGAFTMGWRAG